jgi:hypothetical protein
MKVDNLSLQSASMLFGHQPEAGSAARREAAVATVRALADQQKKPATSRDVPEVLSGVRVEWDEQTGRWTGYGDGWSSNGTEDEARTSAATMASRTRESLRERLRSLEHAASMSYDAVYAEALKRGETPAETRDEFQAKKERKYASIHEALQSFGLQGGELVTAEDGTTTVGAFRFKVQISSRAFTGRVFGVTFTFQGGGGEGVSISTGPLSNTTGSWYQIIA